MKAEGESLSSTGHGRMRRTSPLPRPARGPGTAARPAGLPQSPRPLPRLPSPKQGGSLRRAHGVPLWGPTSEIEVYSLSRDAAKPRGPAGFSATKCEICSEFIKGFERADENNVRDSEKRSVTGVLLFKGNLIFLKIFLGYHRDINLWKNLNF